MPNEFFTMQSMSTLAGATGVTFVICNALQHAFNFNPKWLALVVAQFISITGALYTTPQFGFAPLFVGAINGFLIYCSAVGGTQILSGKTPQAAVPRGAEAADIPRGGKHRQFLTPWW